MTDFLQQWANESEVNAKLFAQEALITQVTEELWKSMDEADLDKAELARRMDKTEGYVSQLLDGSGNIALRTLADICFALGCQPAFLLEPKSLWPLVPRSTEPS